MTKPNQNIEAVPVMKISVAGTSKEGFKARVREDGRSVVVYETPLKKKQDTAKEMAEKWIVCRLKQLTEIADRKRKLNEDLADRLMAKYLKISKLKQERDSLGATMKGLEGEIQDAVKEAAAPIVALVFNWTDSETKSGTKSKGGKPSGKSPAPLRKTKKKASKKRGRA